jgi:O-antigen biosynthesis protein WbqP
MNRAVDFVAAAFGLVLAAPLVVLAAVAIRIETRGSPLFAQPRVGRNEQVFTCYKLRTMFEGTKHLPTHHSSAASVTRVGAVLRSLKIDEVPQLFNVLKGEMSLVGPRPCLTSQKALIDERRRRGVFRVRPGITGLAQVQGVDMSDPERLAVIDATYVRLQNLKTDFGLLLSTVFGKGIGRDHISR